jgi:hypothetical protein
MKLSQGEAKIFVNAANAYVKKNDNKLSFALKKTAKRISQALAQDFEDKLEILRVENCSVDEKGNILRDDKGHYLFTREATKKLMLEAKKLTIDFEPFISPFVPDDLTEEEREELSIVLPTENNNNETACEEVSNK